MLRVWYVYYTGQCGDAMLLMTMGGGYGEKRSDDAVEGGVVVRGWGTFVARPRRARSGNST